MQKTICSFLIKGEFQRRTGDVVKYGTKFIWVKERHHPTSRLLKLSIEDNDIKLLFGDTIPFKRNKVVNCNEVKICKSERKEKIRKMLRSA
jgi:hypothetical protein